MDILQVLENQEVMCLILLDLSVTFNTVDHQIRLSRLKKGFAVTGKALSWFESYLTKCTQAVVIGNVKTNGEKSRSIELHQLVPQGSVLGPIAFALYMGPLGDICRAHGIVFHLYMDDHQVYLSFKPSSICSKEESITKLQSCIEDIGRWMTHNFLKFNTDRAEFILFGTRQQLTRGGHNNIKVGPDTVIPVEVVRILQYMMDKLLKIMSHQQTRQLFFSHTQGHQ